MRQKTCLLRVDGEFAEYCRDLSTQIEASVGKKAKMPAVTRIIYARLSSPSDFNLVLKVNGRRKVNIELPGAL